MNSMMALCNEMAFGRYSIKALLLLYRTVFIHKVLFDSEAWTYVTETNMKMLRIIQLKCLKRIVRTSTGTPNSFLLLEMGVTNGGRNTCTQAEVPSSYCHIKKGRSRLESVCTTTAVPVCQKLG